MRRGAWFFTMAGLFVVMLIGLTTTHGFGTLTETYTNQKGSSQTLELTADKATVKSLVAGSIDPPQGNYVLWDDQKVTARKYRKVEDTYVLVSDENKEWKVSLQPDSSLRDQNGQVWRLQTRSRSFR